MLFRSPKLFRSCEIVFLLYGVAPLNYYYIIIISLQRFIISFPETSIASHAF